MVLPLCRGAGLKHIAQQQNSEIQCSGKTITAQNELRHAQSNLLSQLLFSLLSKQGERTIPGSSIVTSAYHRAGLDEQGALVIC